MSGTDDELVRFVRDALIAGQPRAAIRQAMSEAGWERDQADRALEAYAETGFSIPVPRPRQKLSAREAFLYLTLFAALYLTAWYLGALIVALIDMALPDPVRNPAPDALQRAVRWALSTLIVAAPVYLFLTRKMSAEVRRSAAARASGVRLWLGYLTLFGAAVIIIVDAIALIYNLLNGDLTLAIGLKMLTVAAIAFAIFGYYLVDLRDTKAGP